MEADRLYFFIAFAFDLVWCCIFLPACRYGGGNSQPEVWFEPKVVWEIKVADWSLSPVHKAALGLAHDDKGISFRFPRFLRVRDDRTPTTATSSTEIHDLYQEQFNRKGQDDE